MLVAMYPALLVPEKNIIDRKRERRELMVIYVLAFILRENIRNALKRRCLISALFVSMPDRPGPEHAVLQRRNERRAQVMMMMPVRSRGMRSPVAPLLPLPFRRARFFAIGFVAAMFLKFHSSLNISILFEGALLLLSTNFKNGGVAPQNHQPLIQSLINQNPSTHSIFCRRDPQA